MKYSIYPVLFAFISPLAAAQLDISSAKSRQFRQIQNVVMDMQSAAHPCLLKAQTHTGESMLAKYGKGDPNASWQVLATCISTQKSVPKDKLVEALRSLTEKPAISKALKEYYLSWTATIDVLLSSDVNSPASPARVAMAESSLDRSRKTLELEIELD